MLGCYFPIFLTSPLWLTTIIVGIFVYRLLLDHKGARLPGLFQRMFFAVFCLSLLFEHFRAFTGPFYIDFLLLFVALKCLEIETERDVRFMVLCNIYVMLCTLLLNQALWVFPYILLGVVGSAWVLMQLMSAAMYRLETLKNTLIALAIALPMSVVLFYLFPRLSHPLWGVPTISAKKMGFSEEMNIGSLSSLFQDDSLVMRVVLMPNFTLNLYWRGLVLGHFNGFRWQHIKKLDDSFIRLPPIENASTSSYEILLEPHQMRWLFYQGTPIAANPLLRYKEGLGLVQDNGDVLEQRMSYDVVDGATSYHPLSAREIYLYTELPKKGNPKLRTLASVMFNQAQQNPQAFVKAIGDYIHQQPFWYTLQSDTKGEDLNAMDKFWFEAKRGYCEHYTAAVAIMLRQVNIPTRVIAGYHGGQWNPMAHFLAVFQSNAHAWLEYWQEGIGWQRVDPVIWIAKERVDARILQKQGRNDWIGSWNEVSRKLPWLSKVAYLLESAEFFAERWLLFYNQDTQRILLNHLGFTQWNETCLLGVLLGVVVLFLFVVAVVTWVGQRHKEQPLMRSYHRLQEELERLGVKTSPPATLLTQLQQLGEQQPHLKQDLQSISPQYEVLRLHGLADAQKTKGTLKLWLEQLRKQLKKIK